MYFAIKVGSITNAQRAMRYLRGNGFKANLGRMENPLPADGCGYVIKIKATDKSAVINQLKNDGITVLGVEDI
jgi:hypothetical protein